MNAGDLVNSGAVLLVDFGHLVPDLIKIAKALDLKCEFDLSLFVNTMRPSILTQTKIYYAFSDDENLDNVVVNSGPRLVVDALRREEFLEAIANIHNCNCGLGTLRPSKNKEQKGVDVLIAVDMLKRSYLSACKKVILITGDQDFVPAVRACVDFGVQVEVRGMKNAMSRKLRQEATSYSFIDPFQILQFVLPSGTSLHKVGGIYQDFAAWPLIMRLDKNGRQLEIRERNPREYHLYDGGNYGVLSDSTDLLEKWFHSGYFE